MKRIQMLRRTGWWLALCLWAPWAWGAVTFNTLVTFDGTNGAGPKGGLVQGRDGNFYGTATQGGAGGVGTVFCLSADGKVLRTLYSFTGGSNGANPQTALLQASDGNFYGTTCYGGLSNVGTVFRITPDGGLTVLASLSGTNGAQPDAALIQARDGSLYGTTDFGGPSTNAMESGTGYGSIFRVTTNRELSVPILFDGTNGARAGGLMQAPDGSFYGTTVWGGPHMKGSPSNVGYGTVFQLSTNGDLSTLYAFTGGVDGGWPYAGLVQGSDGNFYGAAYSGGQQYFGRGAIFRITPDGLFTKVHTFQGAEGTFPYSLSEGSDGKFYGTTSGGGAQNLGTVFQMTADGPLTNLHSFTGSDGSNPLTVLVQASDGNFYGTAYSGGAYGKGVIFQVSVPLPPVIRSITATPGRVTLSWSAVASQSYRAQYTADLARAYWTDLGTAVRATNGWAQAIDPAPNDAQRWYRVLVLP